MKIIQLSMYSKHLRVTAFGEKKRNEAFKIGKKKEIQRLFIDLTKFRKGEKGQTLDTFLKW